MKKFDLNEITKTCRQMDCKETINLLNTQRIKLWSWGANGYTNCFNKALKFKVQARRHKGYIYITVNGNDLYDIYLVSTHGNLIKEYIDIFFEDVVDIIDNEIENVKEYQQ
jgi:hypothetical protein